ncbi:uncharacterized protein LOC132275431 [Cornus florida]|uniref:uncharacterized protein LOC132275431 n=1 Tax=Cornus florida TaxID=4283 RepID=UPI002898635E|nr:uncharacterized protein LOC132275431 [Cornus florida]
MEEVFATDVVELDDDDWQIPYNLFLQHLTPKTDRKIKRNAVDYILMDGDLYRRSADDETIVANNGSVFRVGKTLQFGHNIQVKMLTSTPYYAQGNGQAGASNKVVIEIIEKMIKDKLRCWHETLSEALWAYKNLKRTSTGITPYRLTFGHDAVLSMELNVKLARVALQHNLIPADYNETMLAKLEDLDEV